MIRAFGPSVLALLVACGDDAPPPMDSGMDTAPDATPDTGPLVSPIDDAAPPVLTPCPTGWRAVPHPGLGVEVCEPWPESGPADCPPHEMHLPGTPGCRRVGSECPADGWPAALPPGDVVFVRADAAPGGDGTRAAPHRAIDEAVAASTEGATLAVAVGEYDGLVVIDGTRALVGACAEGVVLRRTGTIGGLPIIQVSRDATLDLRDVTLRSDADDRFLSMSANVSIRSVVFDGVGLQVLGGDLAIDDSRIGGTLSDSFTLASIASADTVAVTRSVVTETNTGGMTILARDVSISDVAVSDTGDVGLQVTSGEAASIERVVMENTRQVGAIFDGHTTVADLIVRRVRSDEIAGGLATLGDAALSRVRIEDAGDVAASMAEGVVSVEDLVVFGGRGDGGYERGFELGTQAQIAMSRVVVASMNDFAFLVYDEGTTLDLADVRVEDVASGPFDRFGRCMHAQQNARVTTNRTRFTRCHEAAVTASYGATVQMRDAIVEHILPLGCASPDCPGAQAGIGFVALEGDGAIDVERFSISEVALTAVQVIAGGGIDLRDGTIRNNPVGINVQVEGYDLSRVMDRVIFEDNGANLDTSELPVPAAMVAH